MNIQHRHRLKRAVANGIRPCFRTKSSIFTRRCLRMTAIDLVDVITRTIRVQSSSTTYWFSRTMTLFPASAATTGCSYHFFSLAEWEGENHLPSVSQLICVALGLNVRFVSDGHIYLTFSELMDTRSITLLFCILCERKKNRRVFGLDQQIFFSVFVFRARSRGKVVRTCANWSNLCHLEISARCFRLLLIQMLVLHRCAHIISQTDKDCVCICVLVRREMEKKRKRENERNEEKNIRL